MEIKEVLRRAFKYGEIADIKRMRYEPYKMEVALDAVRIIGTSITPKFVIDGENQWVFEQLVKWMHGDESMMAIDPATGGQIQGRLKSGIYLGGNTGSGKSLALQIMSIYRNIDNIQIRINGEMCCLRFKPYRVDDICDTYAKTGDISKFKKMPILCVQDFGSEAKETLYMGNRINVMQQIIESRGDRGDLVTLLSSNLPLTHQLLMEKYGGRVVSRLTEMCNYIELKGIDRRKQLNPQSTK